MPLAESTERFRECVEIVLAAWQQERLAYKGKYHEYADAEVLPKPAQRPHPPVWVAASSPGAVAWAATQGLSILMDPHSPHDEIARKQRVHLHGLEEAGHDTSPRDTPMARLVVVAPTDAEAAEIARRGARWTGAYIPKQVLAQFRPGRETPPDLVDHYMDDVIIHGSPERVMNTLLAFEESMPCATCSCRLSARRPSALHGPGAATRSRLTQPTRGPAGHEGFFIETGSVP